MNNLGPQNFKDILAKKITTKPPAYEWQQLALEIIKDLKIPQSKRNSVFAVCKKYPRIYLEKCLNETKELCQSGEQWKYFFKLITKTEDDKKQPAKAD